MNAHRCVAFGLRAMYEAVNPQYCVCIGRDTALPKTNSTHYINIGNALKGTVPKKKREEFERCVNIFTNTNGMIGFAFLSGGIAAVMEWDADQVWTETLAALANATD